MQTALTCQHCRRVVTEYGVHQDGFLVWRGAPAAGVREESPPRSLPSIFWVCKKFGSTSPIEIVRKGGQVSQAGMLPGTVCARDRGWATKDVAPVPEASQAEALMRMDIGEDMVVRMRELFLANLDVGRGFLRDLAEPAWER